MPMSLFKILVEDQDFRHTASETFDSVVNFCFLASVIVIVSLSCNWYMYTCAYNTSLLL